MYTEDDLLPISALQHLLFCERQAALIHIEQAWDENRLTAEGVRMWKVLRGVGLCLSHPLRDSYLRKL